jgi:uncharacterized protein (TIGR02284 family)
MFKLSIKESVMTTTTTSEDRETVNHLIEICHDGEEGFTAAGNALETSAPELAAELKECSTQRHDFAADLETQLVQLGEEPSSDGTVAGAARRGWMHLKNALSKNHALAILEACEHNEDIAVSAYRDALARDLPPAIRELVMMQHEAVERVHDRIRMLRDAAKENA